MSNSKFEATFGPDEQMVEEFTTETCQIGDEGKLMTAMSKKGWKYVDLVQEKFWRRSKLTFSRMRPMTPSERRTAHRNALVDDVRLPTWGEIKSKFSKKNRGNQ